MKTNISFSKEAKEKTMAGINKLTDAVSITLGPKGRLVGIAKATPQGVVYDRQVIDDGVGVARAIDLPDEVENMGAALLRESAQKQVDEVGDGTTATIILARAIVNEALKQMSEGKNAMELRKTLETGGEKLVKELAKLKKPIKTLEDKVRVATISSKDNDLGKMIADTFEKVGDDGVITVEESKSTTTEIEHQTGMQFDRGYVSPYFITDPNSMRATLEQTYILVTDFPIMNFMDLVQFLEAFLKGARTLTIIAPDFGGDALPSFIQNKIEGRLASLLVKAPSFGDNQTAMLQDIAVLTGATFISSQTGRDLKSVTLKDLGYASHITSNRDATIISGGRGDKKMIAERIDQIKLLLKDEEVEFNAEKLKERLGKLTEGVAVIKVGGQTETEMKERKERVLDAVSATRSAIKEGIVVGGEVCYLKIRKVVKDNEILYNALKQPFYQLLDNAGLDLMELKFDLDSIDNNLGIDVLDGKAKDMIEAGIIDPLAVPKQSIKNAISVATQIILMGAVITPIIENGKEKQK